MKELGGLQGSVGAAFHICGGYLRRKKESVFTSLHLNVNKVQVRSHRADPHFCDAPATQRGLGVAAYRVIILRVDSSHVKPSRISPSPIRLSV